MDIVEEMHLATVLLARITVNCIITNITQPDNWSVNHYITVLLFLTVHKAGKSQELSETFVENLHS